MEIRFNFDDFEKKFKNITENTIPELIEKGVGKAACDCLGDCILEIPTVPIKEGWLRGSGSAFVQNKFLMSSEGMGGGRTKFVTMDYNEAIEKGAVVGVVGFNAPYAARVHEGVDMQFTEASSGAKYLESKLLRNKKEYMGIIANTIREGGK